MPDTPKKFYLTTPIYYVNARPHIGHAYTTIVADVVARRHRLLGEDVFFLTGTDEHGQKIERAAAAQGIPPQQFADQVSQSFADLWKRMGITNDKFIRTTDPAHKRGAQKLFQTLFDNGYIELRSYTGTYCVSDEAFVDVPVGTPCPECGRITETITEENFFFKLSSFQQQLIDLIESGTLSVEPESRRNEVLSFVRGGLKDLSISRTSFKWGIPVPNNEKHVIYVWLDALTNYMSAIGYGSDAPADIAQFEKYWPADLHLVGKEIIRFHCVYWPAFLLAAKLPLPKKIQAHGWLLFEESKMSKSRGNIVRTETILDAFGPLCPPTPAVLDPTPNAVILSEGASAPQSKDLLAPDTATSAGTFPPQNSPTKAQQDLFAADILRYFLLREIPFGQDGSFSFDAVIQRYNADLANGYGNLVSRTLNMITQYCGAAVPQVSDDLRKDVTDVAWAIGIINLAPSSIGTIPQISTDYVRASSIPTRRTFDQAFEILELGRVMETFKTAVSIADGYISSHEPWKLAKSDAIDSRLKLEETLYIAAETVRIITALLYPILPYATASVWQQLGLGSIEEAARNGELKDLQWGGLKPGTKLGPLAPIFPRADKGLAQIMTEMESPATPAPTAEPTLAETPAVASQPATGNPQPATISIDDFLKIDLRVAQIVVAERIPKADKLLRLEVDLGPTFEPARRQILSGIAKHYTPEELIGRRIAIIANLAPRKMRGLESHGMLLAASADDHGKPILATFSDEVPLGSRIR